MITFTRASVTPVMVGLWHCANGKCFECPYRWHGKDKCRRVLLMVARDTMGALADKAFKDGEGRDID